MDLEPEAAMTLIKSASSNSLSSLFLTSFSTSSPTSRNEPESYSEQKIRALVSDRANKTHTHIRISLMLLPKLTSAFTFSSPISTSLLSRQETNSDPSFTDNTTFQTQILEYQNWFRQQHNVSFLAWNDNLATSSFNWAQQCIWAHSVRCPPLHAFLNPGSNSLVMEC